MLDRSYDDLVQNYDTSYNTTMEMTPQEAVQGPDEIFKNITKSEKLSEYSFKSE